MGCRVEEFNFKTEFLCKTAGEGYLYVQSPIDWPTEAKLDTAGSLSVNEETTQKCAMKFSFMTGIDVYRGQDLTIGVRVTWRVIGDVVMQFSQW